MDFRDMHCFNLVLLAKRVQKLLDDPDSLCARVLHTNYFPSADLLNALIKKDSPFTWLSRFSNRHIWRVGLSDKVNNLG
jgi:hypothetical protein